MDKKVLDILYSKGYLTTYVDAEKYENVDDLITTGLITIPGAREDIYKLLATSVEDKLIVIDVDETLIDKEIIQESDIVDFTQENTIEEVETEIETSNVEEIIEETPVVEEPITETKKKRSTKKAE